MSNNRGIDWSDLIIAILFLLASILAFVNPIATFDILVIALGALVIVHGTIMIINYFRYRNRDTAKSMLWSTLIFGIIEVIFGIVVLANPGFSEIVFTIIFVVWFLSIFIRGLFRVGLLRQINNTLFWVALVINILGLIFALFLVANPLSAYLTIPTILAIEFLFAAIVNFISAFDGHD